MGFGGPAARPVRIWVGPSGSAQLDRIGFFSFFLNLFPVRRTIPEKSVNYFKARKILRKSQKFQENS
jgi:hypothetical protein